MIQISRTNGLALINWAHTSNIPPPAPALPTSMGKEGVAGGEGPLLANQRRPLMLARCGGGGGGGDH